VEVLKCCGQYRRDGDLGPAEFLPKVGCDIEAAVFVEGEDVKARSSNRAWPSIPKLNDYLRLADALSSELYEAMSGGICEHLFEPTDWKPIESIVLGQQENSGRDAHDRVITCRTSISL
jgi:hypothetical protein